VRPGTSARTLIDCSGQTGSWQENGMFDQMIGWTIDRAYLEMASE